MDRVHRRRGRVGRVHRWVGKTSAGRRPRAALINIHTSIANVPGAAASARAASLPFDLATLENLTGGRTDAAAMLASAARLGEFRVGPGESPWYGVSFTTTEKARAAHALAGSLHRQKVPDGSATKRSAVNPGWCR